jgi:acetylornithine/N-succinyldiaminopimelate aminotransferase
MDNEWIKQNDKEYIANTYSRFDLIVERGRGSRVFSNEREYIDFASGIAVSAFGICDNDWINAVTAQAAKLSHTSNLYYTEPAVKLAKLLCEKTDAKKVFFSNSGAEANECAIKAARKYSFDKYGAGRFEIITLENSFHGRTMATITATGQSAFHKYFDPFLEGFKYVPANDFSALESAVSQKTCALMLEIVQCEGGVIVLDREYVKKAAELCAQNNILLIIDEVQTGNGRTGTLYAYMQYGICPDILTTAKGLGGGLPIGATLFYQKTQGVLDYNSHGSTFGGNPVCCAGALSVVSRLNDRFLAEVAKKGEFLASELRKISGVKEISGLGLIVGVATDKPAKDIAAKCLSRGLLVLTAKDKLRLLPALNISYEDLSSGIKIISEALNETSA